MKKHKQDFVRCRVILAFNKRSTVYVVLYEIVDSIANCNYYLKNYIVKAREIERILCGCPSTAPNAHIHTCFFLVQRHTLETDGTIWHKMRSDMLTTQFILARQLLFALR